MCWVNYPDSGYNGKGKKMPYSEEFKEERYELIQDILNRLEDLPEGKTMVVENKSKAEAEKKRWLLFDYFHLMGVKTYKVKRLGFYLLVGKVEPSLGNMVMRREVRTTNAYFEEFIKELISAKAPREVASELIKKENLSFAALSVILAEYSRVME